MMKNKAILLAAICVSALNINVFAQLGQPEPTLAHYVVIGAFAIKSNAIKHVATAKKLNLNAVSVVNLNLTRILYYVYVIKTDDKEMAIAEAEKLRKTSPFWDTWVYSGVLGVKVASKGTDLDPTTRDVIAKVDGKDDPMSDSTSRRDTTKTAPPDDGGKNFWFKIFSSEGELEGGIDIIDVEKSKKVASYAGNQQVRVRPVNKSGSMALVCEVFGYRKLQKNLNFSQPLDTDGAVEENGQVVVPFELVRLQKGDFGVMYHVYFFKDAAIMRPESRYEVNNLTKMMKDNLKYKIRLHGHTNGNAHGKVILVGEKKNFFSLNGSKDGRGSAYKLSQERAELIRDYLVNEGIDASRMEIKAWGGKKPLYDVNSPQAQANVRVEIEILEDK